MAEDKITYEIVDPSAIPLQGPPVPPAMQAVFGWYKPGVKITGIITLPIGISVGFEDGSDIVFVPQSCD